MIGTCRQTGQGSGVSDTVQGWKKVSLLNPWKGAGPRSALMVCLVGKIRIQPSLLANRTRESLGLHFPGLFFLSGLSEGVKKCLAMWCVTWIVRIINTVS